MLQNPVLVLSTFSKTGPSVTYHGGFHGIVVCCNFNDLFMYIYTKYAYQMPDFSLLDKGTKVLLFMIYSSGITIIHTNLMKLRATCAYKK